jgi:hypothetical protein
MKGLLHEGIKVTGIPEIDKTKSNYVTNHVRL